MLSFHSQLWFRYMTVALCAYWLLWTGCTTTIERKTYQPRDVSQDSLKDVSELKAHLKDGSLWVFSAFTFDEPATKVMGPCVKYNARRVVVQSNVLPDTLHFSDVSLFETNKVVNSPSATALLVVVGIIGAVFVPCIGSVAVSGNKGCWGSCPTFYTFDEGSWQLRTEGFSSSILPALEKQDIDALPLTHPSSRDFVLRMKNEALETHVVRHVNILAVPYKDGEQVYHTTADDFIISREAESPLHCFGPEGEITKTLAHFDETERSTEADSLDLCQRELIEAEFFNPAQEQAALVVGFRQSLMNTFLYYQTLAYMGKDAGAILAKVQSSSNPHSVANKLYDALGGIDVEVFDGSSWKEAGSVFEIGPIAQNLQAIRLPRVHTPTIKLRLRMTKGYWRINSLQLAPIIRTAEAKLIQPIEVLCEGKSDAKALAQLLDENQTLTTVAGDEYDIRFQLPSDYTRHKYYVDAKGYYLEWIRKEWLGEESASKVTQLFLSPRDYIREETQRYKLIEPSMEQSFWNSRYARPH